MLLVKESSDPEGRKGISNVVIWRQPNKKTATKSNLVIPEVRQKLHGRFQAVVVESTKSLHLELAHPYASHNRIIRILQQEEKKKKKKESNLR